MPFTFWINQLPYTAVFITCIWLLVRLIALVNAMTRYFDSRSAKSDK